MSAVIDPTKPTKYPVVLSDALLGGTAKDVFTNVRYNHKPDLSSETSPEQARLKPAIAGSTSSYELSFQDEGGKYAYAGTRTIGENQYILYFDPSRKVFVLDRIDSTFNMNLTRTPDNSDPDSLRQQFEQLDTSITADTSIVAKSAKKPAATKTAVTKAAPKTTKKEAAPRRKAPPKKKKEEPKSIELSLPEPAPPKPAPPEPKKEPEKPQKKKKRPDPESEEDEDDDDDGGLLVEYPGAEPNRQNDFSPAFPENTFPLRRFSEFAEKLRESGNEDFDEEGESDNEDIALSGFKLPSPVGKKNNRNPAYGQDDEDEEDDDAIMEDVNVQGNLEADLEADLQAGLENELEAHLKAGLQSNLEDDLAAELENELMQANSGGDADSESEVSEED